MAKYWVQFLAVYGDPKLPPDPAASFTGESGVERPPITEFSDIHAIAQAIGNGIHQQQFPGAPRDWVRVRIFSWTKFEEGTRLLVPGVR